jgi:type IV secretion system protein VirB10
MPVQDIGDPRLQALFGASDPRDAGVKPVVRLPQKGLPPAVLAIAALAFALILFAVLKARRTSQPEATAQAGGPVGWDAPPPLYIPPVEAPPAAPLVALQAAPAPQVTTATAPAPRPAPLPMVYAPQPAPQIAPSFAPPAPRVSAGTPLVIDTGSAAGAGTGPASNGGPLALPNQSAGRQRASAFANRSTTVPQGSIIPAVLETGFDSSKPGFARAVVSRDVRGFDGKNILIPRGSRLIGEYRSDVAAGQKRAIINWTRLIRPDGMTIAMDSPAIDTLGRGGVPASVNTHFFQQLTGALLQSTFSIGSTLAGRAVTGPVVVLPGGGTSASPQFASNNITPTLTVAPGKSISVFVAHDLDFSSAEGVR